MARCLIEAAEAVLTVDPAGRVLTDTSIVIEDDRIRDMGPADTIRRRYADVSFDRVLSGRRRLVTPGFVDAHLHLSEQLARGVFPDCLSTRPWVFNWAKPVYAAMRREDEEVATLLAAVEMIKKGTTCFLDMGAQDDVGTVVAAIERAGIRGITGRHAADRMPQQVPAHWTQEMIERHFFPSAEAALEELERSVRRYHQWAGGRVRVWVNIEGKEPCSPELHRGARELAERLGVGTTYHIASSLEEAELSEQKYGMWPVSRLKAMGALGPNLVLAHVVAIRDEEIDALYEAGTKVAFCPGTALKIAKGATRIGKYPEMLAKGVTVVLGSDGPSASGSLDMLRQMYLVAGLFKDCRMDPFLVPAEQALRMATIEGAKALLWDDEIGSVEVGKKADLVLWNLDEVDFVPYTDILQTLVYSATPASVDSVLIDGRLVMEGRRILTLNEDEVKEAAREHARRVVERAGVRIGVTPVTTDAYN